MNWGDGLLALLGICAFSLLWARKWELNAALLPLPGLGASVVWLWLFGMANQLALGGWLWFAGAAAALCLLLVGGHKGQSLPARLKAGGLDALHRAAVPGFVFFVGAALFFWILFALTQPMFIRWDEFTFWGTACKMTKEANQLHAVAPGNLSARAYLPGMMRRMVAITQRYDIPWVTFGKRSKKGHPHHPLYLRKDSTPEPFDVENYLDTCF